MTSKRDSEDAGGAIKGLLNIIQFIIGTPVAVYAFFAHGSAIDGFLGSIIIAGGAYIGTGLFVLFGIGVIGVGVLIAFIIIFALWKIAGFLTN